MNSPLPEIRAAPRSWLAYSLLTILVHLGFFALTITLLVRLITTHADPLHPSSANQTGLFVATVVLDSLLATLTCSNLLQLYYQISLDAYDDWEGIGHRYKTSTRYYLVAVTVLVIAVISLTRTHSSSLSSQDIKLDQTILTVDILFPLVAVMLISITLYGTFWTATSVDNTISTLPTMEVMQEVVEYIDPDTTLVEEEPVHETSKVLKP